MKDEKFSSMKKPPICLHAIAQPLVNAMWEELRALKAETEKLKKDIKHG